MMWDAELNWPQTHCKVGGSIHCSLSPELQWDWISQWPHLVKPRISGERMGNAIYATTSKSFTAWPIHFASKYMRKVRALWNAMNPASTDYSVLSNSKLEPNKLAATK